MNPKKKTDFEQRAEQAAKGLPVNRIKNKDGSYSTHKMASAEVDGKYIAHPTIVNKGGKLIELSPKEATKYALKTGEYKEFKTEKESRKYAEGEWKDPNYYAVEAVKKILER